VSRLRGIVSWSSPGGRDRGANGSFRVVFTRRLDASTAHRFIADVPIDASAVRGDDFVDGPPELVHHACHNFCVDGLRRSSEAGDIDEQHCRLPLALNRWGLDPARVGLAEPQLPY
jgi:hypothetical protein